LRVHAALNKWQRRSFSYGDADCCQFIAFVVNELTGKNYAAQFTYRNETQAKALVARQGNLLGFIGSILGKPADITKDGDPCVVDLPIVGEACGIRLGQNVVCLTEKGMTQIPARYIVAGWAV